MNSLLRFRQQKNETNYPQKKSYEPGVGFAVQTAGMDA